VLVRVVDIFGIADHHCLNFHFIIKPVDLIIITWENELINRDRGLIETINNIFVTYRAP